MFKCKKNKLWLEYIPNLICDYSLIPLNGMSLAEQMNALTRFVIIITLVLYLFNFRFSLLFLLLSLLFIIILYYIQKSNMDRFNTENYTKPAHSKNLPSPQFEINPTTQQFIFNNPTTKRFCNDQLQLDGQNGAFNNPNWISVNQQLAGPPNPKTKIAPVVVPPPADLSYWKANNLITHSAINQETNIDVYQSGYQVSTCCAPTYDCQETCRLAIPIDTQFTENYIKPNNTQSNNTKPNNKEEYQLPYFKINEVDGRFIRPNGSGQVNTSCGYNPEQLFSADLPTNLPVGNCQKDPVMKTYNKNLFTQTIQPGIYTRNEINEPLNSNIGISFTQQFPPTTCTTNPITGEINYTEHDPRIIEPVINEPNLEIQNAITEANIYDPRFSGYGTSYRSYTDDLTGQTRFYYDDVDAIRMPNYIVRSDIDHQPFADQYGPIPIGDSYGNKFNPNMHALANDAFLQGSIQQRTELSERLMRKVNAEHWRRRQAPKYTGGQRMLGGMSCK